MNENQLTVLDENGNEILCNILFTFESEVAHKNIVIFYPVEQDESEDDSIELSAAFYVEGENGQGDLEAIEDDAVWDEIEDAIHQYEEEMDGCGCGCHDGHCECGCEEGHCECGPECDCGCQEGEPCTCGTECDCGCQEGHCECGPECDCGCQEGKPCTCGGSCKEE